MAFADVTPVEEFDPRHPVRLAVPELASTALFQYYKDVQCIKLEKYPDLIPASQPPYKPVSAANFVSYQVCERYKPLGTRVAGNAFTCDTNCRPLLPELYGEMLRRNIPPDTEYYFDVNDIANNSLLLPRAHIASLVLWDLTSAWGIFKGVKILYNQLGFFTSRQLTGHLTNWFSKNSADQLSKAQAYGLASTLRIALNTAQKNAGVTKGAGLIQFATGVVAIETAGSARESLPAGKKNVGEDEATQALLASFGGTLNYDTHFSMQRFTKFNHFNDSVNMQVRGDDFRLISEGECQDICGREFKAIMANRYMGSRPKYKDCTYNDFGTDGPQLNSSGKDINNSCDMAAVDSAIRPILRACEQRCKDNCMLYPPPPENDAKYRSKSPREKTLAYLLGNEYGRQSAANIPTYASSQECVDFPEYKELSIPEVAILWASLIRNAIPQDTIQRYADIYPSEKFKAMNTDQAISLGPWETTVDGHPRLFTNPYYSTKASSRGFNVAKAETKSQPPVQVSQRDCPQNCEDQWWDFMEECKANHNVLKNFDWVDLNWCQRSSIHDCIEDKTVSCLNACRY